MPMPLEPSQLQQRYQVARELAQRAAQGAEKA